MSIRWLALVASAIASLVAVSLLVGCTAPPLPAGPTPGELDAKVAAELDRQWAFTGLEGVVERPVVPESHPTESWDDRRYSCMADSGIPTWGTDEEGLTFDGREPTVDEQVAYYGCYALYPTVEMLSTAQLDYVYGYYARFLVPCLAAQGYRVNPTSRATFVDDPTFDGWRWNPYQALVPYPRDQDELDDLLAVCPAALPGVPGWENAPY